MLAPEPPPATHQLDMSAESHLFVMLNHSTVHQQACGWIASTSQPIAIAIYHQADRFFCQHNLKVGEAADPLAWAWQSESAAHRLQSRQAGGDLEADTEVCQCLFTTPCKHEGLEEWRLLYAS